MKKLIVLLLAFAMAGAAFAADEPKPALTFGFYGDVVANLYDSTAVDTGSWGGIYSETYFNYKAKDMAFSATTVGGADFFAAVRNYSFSYNLMPDFGLKILAGKLREGPNRIGSYIDGNGFSTRSANVEEGVELYASKSGFTGAVFAPIGTNDYKVAASVGYAVPNLVTVVGGYRMVNKELWVSADVKAVKGLTAKVGFRNVGTTNWIYATAGSASLVEGIDVGLDANVVLASGATDFGVKAKAELAMDPYAFGVIASFDSGADAWYKADGVTVNPYAVWNFAAGDIILGMTFDSKSGDIAIPLEFEVSF
ncbi:MAG: hypothetical protein CVV53_02900 [Spirochaetae bacterium HGW-Spirochaetae-9]|nr:MAG: hypothetical protein CVV53_02900 [Spirochaetae bacterium HGW-Spirochaetae-9]